MAKTLKSYDKEDSEFLPGKPRIYPWDEWFDGRIWQLRQGEDFNIDTDSMLEYIRKTASRYGFRTSVFKHDEYTIVIKPREDEDG